MTFFSFKGIEQVQIVSLNTNFGTSLEFKEVQNGFELFAANNLIRITIDVDIEDFSVLNIQRNMTIKDVATDCFSLGKRKYNCL